MPQRDVAKPATAVFLIAAVILASACSRLTFIKPNVNRGHYEQIASQVHIDPRSKAHDTAFTMTQVAQSRLMSGDTAGAPMRWIDWRSMAVIGRAATGEAASATAAAARRSGNLVMTQA